MSDKAPRRPKVTATIVYSQPQQPQLNVQDEREEFGSHPDIPYGEDDGDVTTPH